MYERFFGLSSPPFRLSPDPEFFFNSPGHKRALAYLRYGLNQREGFIVVTGAPGTGKTTLARALLRDVEKDKIIVSELNNTKLQAEDVLRMVAASFHIEHEGQSKAGLLKKLEGYFLSRYRAGYHVVLMIDEAQNLPADSLEELRMLSNFYHGTQALLQIFLLGQEQLRATLNSPEMEQLRQRIVAACYLTPLTLHQTRDYILHRLGHVGWATDPRFSKRSFAHVYAYSKGIPRRINTFMDRLLLAASLEEIHDIDSKFVDGVAQELMQEGTTQELSTGAIEAEGEGLGSEFEDDRPEPMPVAETELPVEDQTSRPLKVVNGDEALEWSEPLVEPAHAPHGTDHEFVELVQGVLAYAQGRLEGEQVVDESLLHRLTDLFELGLAKELPAALAADEFLATAGLSLIRSSIRLYIKEVLLAGDADYYRRLGVPHDAELEKIKTHYRYLFRLFQPDQEAEGSQWEETYTRRINQAYATLRDEEKRAQYDLFLQALNAEKAEEEMAPAEQRFMSALDSLDEGQEVPKRRWPLVAVALLVVAGVAAVLLMQSGQLTPLLDEGDDGMAPLASDPPAVEVPAAEVTQPTQTKPEVVPVASKAAEVKAEPVKPKPAEKKPVKVTKKVEAVKPVAVKPKPAPKPEPKPAPKVVKKAVNEPKVAPPVVAAAPVPAPKPEPVEPAPAATPEVAPTTVQPDLIEPRHLAQFIRKFSRLYRSGNLEKFMALFSEQATTNDRQGKTGIAEDYRLLFASTDSRSITLTDLQWQHAENIASGRANFIVEVLARGEAEQQSYVGLLDIVIIREGDELLLRSLRHRYQ